MIHNKVNLKLGKPEYDCEHWALQWRLDASCNVCRLVPD